MADDISAFAKLNQPLSDTLAMLREESRSKGSRNPHLVRWAAHHPQIAKGADWLARAWWGAAAGEIVRAHLYDREHRSAALGLVEQVESQPLIEAMAGGQGVIVLTAHLGPPKFLMNWLIDQAMPLLVWTNTQDLPAWQATASGARLVDPRNQDKKSVVLVNAALHLRRKGVLLGAADMDTGDRTVTIERLGFVRTFSLGLPALARALAVPTVVGLAVWNGNHIRIRFLPLEPPASSVSDDEWSLRWLGRSWELVEPVLAESPENLRFLQRAVERIAKPWEETGQRDFV